MDIYVAVRDRQERDSRSIIIGSFDTEKKARAACQEEANENAEASGSPSAQLAWKDTTAAAPDGDIYSIILTSLSQRN